MVVVDADEYRHDDQRGEYAEFKSSHETPDAVGMMQGGSRTPTGTVAKTGVAEIGAERQTIHGRSLIVNRIPLKDGDRVIGAWSVVFKTVEQLRELASKICTSRPEGEILRGGAHAPAGRAYTLETIIGASVSISAAKRSQAERVSAGRDFEGLLAARGDRDGKELFAHAIHAAGPRAGPFIKLNWRCLPVEWS